MTVLDLTFDAESHKYAWRGRPVRNVTSALFDAGLVDYSYCTEFALWRGSNVHKAIHVELSRGLDWSSVPESFHPFIGAAKQYLEDHHAQLVEVERRVFSKLYDYAGTLDIIMREHAHCGCLVKYGQPAPAIKYPPKGKLVLVDWKTGPPRPATALQLAAYANAYFEETRLFIDERRAVHLMASGEYKATPYTDRNDRDDFLAALRVARKRREYGLIQEAA